MPPTATIIFITHNRCQTLRQAILSAQKQSVPVKIMVMDDASTDETSEMMASEFPDIEYHRSSQNLGPCYHRNRGIEMATTEIIFGLDDDSILQSSYTVEQTLAEFTDDKIGAVAIPYVNILENDEVLAQNPDKAKINLTFAFGAGVHAVRRTAVLKAGCYREQYFFMGEEGDLSIRMLQQGFFVRLGGADPIHHLRDPNRKSAKIDILARRNDILFFYCNAPNKYLAFYLAGTTVKGIWDGIRSKRLGNTIKGFVQGYKFIAGRPDLRAPVSSECFKLYRLLKKRGCLPITEMTFLTSKLNFIQNNGNQI